MSIEDSFRFKSLSYSGHSVIKSIQKQRIELDADFKDIKWWPTAKSSLFIESLMLGIPTQPIWCEETQTGQFVVIDGSERLRALYSFYSGDLTLCELKIKKEYLGNTVNHLPYHTIIGIEDRYNFEFKIIDYDTHPILKREFYRRLTENDKKSNSQMARNFAYRNALNYLRRLRCDTCNYINFTSRGKLYSSLKISESRIDEIFLRLLHFLVVLDNNVYHDLSNTVDDELDNLMSEIDGAEAYNSRFNFDEKANKLLETLVILCKHYNGPLSVEIAIKGIGNENFHLSEFYHYFIRAASGNLPSLAKTTTGSNWLSLQKKSDLLHLYIQRILND